MKKEQGFTLIEVLISLSIIAIIFVAIINSNIMGFRVLHFNQEKIDNQQLSRIIMSRIRPYIRLTTEIDTSYLPDQLHIKFYPQLNEDRDYNGMTFGLKENAEFFYQKHYLDGSLSNQMSITSSDNILVKNLSFSYLVGQKTIEISFTLENRFVSDYKVVDRILLRNTEIITP